MQLHEKNSINLSSLKIGFVLPPYTTFVENEYVTTTEKNNSSNRFIFFL